MQADVRPLTPHGVPIVYVAHRSPLGPVLRRATIAALTTAHERFHASVDPVGEIALATKHHAGWQTSVL
jgi:hypothetical protein